MINSRFFGSIMLVVGTSIGGGMLALPVVTAIPGYFYSSLAIIAIWFFMTAGSLLVLEVNLALPTGSNLVNMARVTLGRTGMIIAWLSYGLILYSVLCAYIAGGADLLNELLKHYHLTIPAIFNHFIYVLVLGSIVWLGTSFVDYANRILMFLKLATLLVLMLALIPKTSFSQLPIGNFKSLPPAFMVMATSFTFSIIVPSLRYYLDSNVRQIRSAIIIGSIIPLICYLAWNYLVQSTVSTTQLIQMQNSGQVVASLTLALSKIAHHPLLSIFAKLFTSICMFTTFLAASLSLSDFIADGIGIKPGSHYKWIATLLTFLPPLAILTLDPNLFLAGISMAGIFCAVIVMILPPLMAWKLRYNTQKNQSYQMAGGKILLILLFLVGISLILTDLLHRF